MSEEFDVALFSEMYPPSVHSTSTPPQLPFQIQNSEEPKQRRRRRRKNAKKESEMNGSEGWSSKKRKLSNEQAKMLERSFGLDHKLESERKDRLAAEVGLEPKQVAVWFQNRRARWKNKKVEDEYFEIRSQYDAVLQHNCHLETQLMKLREELNEAEKEVKWMSAERVLLRSRWTNNSPTPSSDTNTAPLLQMHAGDFNFHAADFQLQDQDAYNIPTFHYVD